jgi:Zn-dependent protease with chaperone function
MGGFWAGNGVFWGLYFIFNKMRKDRACPVSPAYPCFYKSKILNHIMTDASFLYPATPANVPESVTQVSPAFKKEVSGVMGSIILFFIVYLLMFLLSVGLVVACVYGGIALIAAVPRLITIIIGLGLIGVGVMVFVFLIKFLFAVSRYDSSNSIEITKEDQPKLFAFIARLTNDVQTPFPKKIYVSPDVNAAVFYNSSFWSMFLPVRKNLQIGLGLVNSLNVSEFKAVMAHEFGHFSQRSMKLGSFVYNVNKIIHNMLFQNTSYAGFLGSWASVDGIFAFFAQITAGIAQGIQSILRQMYGIINKSYMRLSREMEFHADAVAASVTGSQSLVTALRRIELANAGYNIALQKCDELFRQKKMSNNIYQNHRTVLRQLADEFKLTIEHDIPVVNDKFLADNNASRVNFKDQWASHPATNDRVEHLNKLKVEAELVTEPAWVLFENKDDLQLRLTQKIYENVVKDKELTTIESNEFEEKLNADIRQYSLPDEYNGFYDGRQVSIVNTDELQTNGKATTWEEIFSADNASLPKKIKTNAADLEVLKAINEKNIRTKTFDFDGVKYKREDAPSVIAILQNEQEKEQAQLVNLDKQAIHFFFDKAAQKGITEKESLKKAYADYFENRRLADEFLKDINRMLESLQPVFSGQTIQITQINVMIDDLKSDHEAKFKNWLKRWITSGVFDKNPAEKQKAENFIAARYVYFGGTTFIDTELITLNELCNESWAAVNTFLFIEFKSILERQLILARN